MAQKGPLALRLWKFKTAYIEDETPVDDLAFLSRHRDTLRELSITGDERLDVAEINQLRALEILNIHAPGGANAMLRLGGLPALSQLIVFFRGDQADRLRIDWAGSSALERVSLDGPDAHDLAAIVGLPRLRDLTLDNFATMPERFTPGLEELALSGVGAWPATIDGLDHLVSLDLAESATLRDLTPFAGAEPLESLVLYDLPGLRSLAGVRVLEDAHVSIQECPNLEDLGALSRESAEGSITGSPLVGCP